MTTASNDLSRLELIVLARLSSTKPPSATQLVKDVAALAFPSEAAGQAQEPVLQALAGLRNRGLVNKPRNTLNDKGEQQLRKAFELSETPTWAQVRDEHLAARELGLRPGSDDAIGVFKAGPKLAVAILRASTRAPKASTVISLCDALIADALGVPPGPVTLERIRAHVLARHAKIEAKGSLDQIAVAAAAAISGIKQGNKRLLADVLARRWAYTALTSASGTGSRAADAQLPLPPAPRTITARTNETPAVPPKLLDLVREAIPHIGSDGRFGNEKVFVSAIWHRIERDHKVPDMSLDRFKRWLVNANRDQLIDLARADLVGAMDPKLVAESAIEDLGATFHFVIDRASAQARGLHAR
jgi:hypothetical protein